MRVEIARKSLNQLVLIVFQHPNVVSYRPHGNRERDKVSLPELGHRFVLDKNVQPVFDHKNTAGLGH